MTQEQLAKKIGTKQSPIARIESGNATKILKDGDQVEVDTEAGIVIKL